MDFRLQHMNGFIDSMSKARIDGELGESMGSYSLDANVVLLALGLVDQNITETKSGMVSRLDGLKTTIYRSTMDEICYVLKHSHPDRSFRDLISEFGSEFKKTFDNYHTRIVVNDDTCDSVIRRLGDKSPDAANFLGLVKPTMGEYDCQIMAQSMLEGNTVCTYDGLMIGSCKGVGIDVIHGGIRPVSYKGPWESNKFLGYGNFTIKNSRK